MVSCGHRSAPGASPAVAGKVGIFWKCLGRWWIHACDMAGLAPDSLGFVDDPIGHHDYWQELRCRHPELEAIEYDDSRQSPRGRIIFDSRQDVFAVYMARCLHTKSIRAEIVAAFGLPRSRTRFRTDEHYE